MFRNQLRAAAFRPMFRSSPPVRADQRAPSSRPMPPGPPSNPVLVKDSGSPDRASRPRLGLPLGAPWRCREGACHRLLQPTHCTCTRGSADSRASRLAPRLTTCQFASFSSPPLRASRKSKARPAAPDRLATIRAPGEHAFDGRTQLQPPRTQPWSRIARNRDSGQAPPTGRRSLCHGVIGREQGRQKDL